MASSTDTILRSDDFCNSGIYPFVVRDIERMHQLILEDDDDDDDGVAANADEEEEFLWFLPRADESKSEFLGRAKIIGDNRRATQDKKKSPSPAKSAQPHYQSLEAAAPYASSSSTPSSSEAAAAAIVRTSKYGMRCLNMGAGHYRKMVRISTTIASSSSHRVVSSRFKAANALRNAAVAAARLPTASTNLLPPSSSVLPADNAPTQTKDPLTHDQLYAQLKELMSQRYRQFLVEAGAKVDDRLLDDIFQSPINEDEDACEANSATVCNAAVEIDSSGPPAVTSPAPHSADSAAFSPQVDASASPISTERQRRARHSNDHCRTCPGCRATAPKTSMIALAALAASNLPLSAVSSPSTKDRPASSGGSALAAPSNDNRSCACCQRTSVTRRFEWSECEAMCDDCAQPYADFIDDPVGTIVRRRCSDQCKRKLEQQSDAQRCESCHYWSSVDAVRDVIDKRRPPRPTVDNDVIRVNRRKQSMPTSDSKPKPRSETTFVPIYESDDVKELYDLTGPRLRHVCRTSPLAKKTQSLSLSFLPLSWRRMLQEEEKLRYADETPVESRRQKWLKRGTKHDHRNSCGGSSRPMTTKSKKGVGPRRNTGDADAFGSAAKKRRRHTSGFEDDPQSIDYFYKPVTSRSATKEEANAASESPPSLEASVVVGPLTTDGDRRRKSRSRAPASPSPIADQQATHEHRRSNSFDRHDSLRPKSNASCHTDAAPSAELPQPSTPPFDSFKDAMRQCTVPISPLEHKEVYIRLRQSEKKCHLPSRNEERKETSAGHNRLPNGFVSMNGSGGDVDRPAVNGNGQSLTKERHVSIEKVLKQPKTGGHPSVSPNGLNKQRESLLLSEEQKLKKIARKTLRSAACELSVFGAWPMSESQFSAPTRPPLSVRLSADEGRLIESDGVSADTLSIGDMEEKLADSAAPNGVELFNGDDRHYAEENERREQHERHAHRVPDHNDQRVDPLPL